MSKMNTKVLTTTKMLTTLGLLLATEIVLSRFLSISAWNFKIGFSFVPVVLAAMLYGWWGAAAVAGLGDFLGATLFPIGPYFPGFTLTAALTGCIFGLLLYREKSVLNRILSALIAVWITQFVLSLLLNTYWIHVLYGSPFMELLATRALQAVLMSVTQFVTIVFALYPLTDRLKGVVTA